MRENGSINKTRGGGFDKYLQYKAKRPFAYRLLVPSIADIAEPMVMSNLSESLEYKFTTGTPLREYMKVRQDEPVGLVMSVRYHIAYFISFASLLGLAFTLRGLTIRVTPEDVNLANFAPLVFILLLPLTFLHGGFLYDFPELLLLSLSFLYILRDQKIALCIVMFLAVLNKESNVLIPLFYLAYEYRGMPNRAELGRFFIMTAVSMVGYILGQHLTRNADGVVVMNHLTANLQFIGSGGSWFLWFRAYGGLVPFPRKYNILMLGLMFFVVVSVWKSTQLGLRRVFALTFCINLCLVLAFGNADEMRNWSLVFVPLYLLVVKYFSMPRWRGTLLGNVR